MSVSAPVLVPHRNQQLVSYDYLNRTLPKKSEWQALLAEATQKQGGGKLNNKLTA